MLFGCHIRLVSWKNFGSQLDAKICGNLAKGKIRREPRYKSTQGRGWHQKNAHLIGTNQAMCEQMLNAELYIILCLATAYAGISDIPLCSGLSFHTCSLKELRWVCSCLTGTS